MFPPHTAHFCPSQNILKPNAKDMSRELCQDPWTLNQAASLWCLKNMNSSTAVLQNTQGGIMLQQSWGCNFPTKRRKTNKQKVSLNIMLAASAWALLDLLLAQGLAITSPNTLCLSATEHTVLLPEFGEPGSTQDKIQQFSHWLIKENSVFCLPSKHGLLNYKCLQFK